MRQLLNEILTNLENLQDYYSRNSKEYHEIEQKKDEIMKWLAKLPQNEEDAND